jgi:predicted DNA-binding transcriptional regulator AlpA
MTREEFNRLPMMIGTKQVLACLGIGRATLYRAIDDGRMLYPTKIGSSNRWRKEYILKVMDGGFDPRGTHSPAPKSPPLTSMTGARTNDRPTAP